MKHADFVPLHLHTEYSLLDGAIRISELTERAVEFKMPAVAITDHGNLFGAVEFYQKTTKAGLKPIIGCEVYVTHSSRFEKTKGYFHLILLSKDMTGYRNLVKIVTQAYTEGFYYKPRVDRQLIESHSEGLIALSACLKGEVPYLLNHGQPDQAREIALWYKELFGAENYYLEIQENGLPEQTVVNKNLISLSKELDIKLVATNDCHYLNKDDYTAHDILLCIQTGKTVDDENRLKFGTDQLYFKSPEEMKAAFSEVPEAVLNTREIAEKCNLTFELHKFKLPEYHLPDGGSPDSYMEELARDGLKDKIGETPEQEYTERFDRELKIIKKMGFSSYFLIVCDFIGFARKKGIPVGPGRGSAAGSLVAYCLGITNLDPLKYHLLFERFLNPDRISMPDIDVDFCRDRRSEVIEYTTQKYGIDHVAQIVTFGTMAAKACIRDVGRALNLAYSEVDKIAKLVPTTLNITIKEAIEIEPDLKKEYTNSPDIKKLLDIAIRLEGLCRHTSTHAAGLVISPAPLTDYTPIYKNPVDESRTTQFDMKSIETIGLIKFDFLGLKTLTIIKKTIEYIEHHNALQGLGCNPNMMEAQKTLDIDKIPLDDLKTFELLSSGHTTGVFQLESDGMRDILLKMTPNRFEDLIALVALYRPGPIGSGMVDDFIKRKKGNVAVTYDLPQLKECLDETYGVILYQEQVMRIANKIANFSMGKSDILRKAMGKKNAEEMEKLKGDFVAGATENGIKEHKSGKLFDLMALFAKYGFNKSHSAAYALIAYQTAYLKAHYPVEFMAANLSIEDNADKLVTFIKECRAMNIEILPPDINNSEMQFKIIGNSIKFGLEAVKGVGAAAIESIIATRANTPFISLEDFVIRVDSRKVNKKVLESLIKSGAFDSLIPSRAMAFEDLGFLLNGSKDTPSLFGTDSFLKSEPKVEKIHEWPNLEKLSYEKETLGIYLTGHPLSGSEADIRKIGARLTSQLENSISGSEVMVAGIITTFNKKQGKKGPWVIFTLEDHEGSIEVLAFSDQYLKSKDILEKNSIVAITGKLDISEKGNKIIATDVKTLSNVIKESHSKLDINLFDHQCNHENFILIKQVLDSSKGRHPVYLNLHYKDKITTIMTTYLTDISTDVISKLESAITPGIASFV
ncbi:MAG: DNA polymerase III subunit alpha [Nitrospirae bacterium]|nr:DNA polymerase III subunit alpha [Nitrospirota bacterium]